MRKFYVHYRVYQGCGEYEYKNDIITLDKKKLEIANPDTFIRKIHEMCGGFKVGLELLSWSLIEEP